MDFEGEAFDVCEDFEKEFADELEMMGIMETESTAQEESEWEPYINDFSGCG